MDIHKTLKSVNQNWYLYCLELVSVRNNHDKKLQSAAFNQLYVKHFTTNLRKYCCWKKI